MIKIPTLQELLEAGVHFGHQVRRGHPRMKEYIFGVRDGVHIINLEESEKLLKEAAEKVYNFGKEGKVILFVGTKKQAQPIIKELAESVGAPFMTYRWIGGFLTNFDEVRKNVRKLAELQTKKEKGDLSRYTKKEQLLISRKLEKFDREYGGVANLDRLPDIIFLSDCATEKTALSEANRIHLPVVAIADSNCNPALVDYPIPGNDDATKSLRILIGTIINAYGQGLKEAGVKKEKEEKAAAGLPVEEEIVESEAIAADVEAAEEKVEEESSDVDRERIKGGEEEK